MSHTDFILFKGWLVKSPPFAIESSNSIFTFKKLRPKWRRRYFVLYCQKGKQAETDNIFYFDYFKDEQRTKRKGTIDLLHAKNISTHINPPTSLLSTLLSKYVNSVSHPDAYFSLETKQKSQYRTYVFLADSIDNMKRWADQLSVACNLKEIADDNDAEDDDTDSLGFEPLPLQLSMNRKLSIPSKNNSNNMQYPHPSMLSLHQVSFTDANNRLTSETANSISLRAAVPLTIQTESPQYVNLLERIESEYTDPSQVRPQSDVDDGIYRVVPANDEERNVGDDLDDDEYRILPAVSKVAQDEYVNLAHTTTRVDLTSGCINFFDDKKRSMSASPKPVVPPRFSTTSSNTSSAQPTSPSHLSQYVNVPMLSPNSRVYSNRQSTLSSDDEIPLPTRGKSCSNLSDDSDEAEDDDSSDSGTEPVKGVSSKPLVTSTPVLKPNSKAPAVSLHVSTNSTKISVSPTPPLLVTLPETNNNIGSKSSQKESSRVNYANLDLTDLTSSNRQDDEECGTPSCRTVKYFELDIVRTQAIAEMNSKK